MSSIGDRIKQRREELGMSQEELALKVGYTGRSAINKIEVGRTDVRRAKIKPIANALNVSVSYLMGWEEENNNDAIADIIIKMRSDSLFFELVRDIASLNEEQIKSVRSLLNAFVK